MWYVTEYASNRVYGGPEEGGWWYSTLQFLEVASEHATQEAAEAARAVLFQAMLDARPRGWRPRRRGATNRG